jgi:hypothetical protein
MNLYNIILDVLWNQFETFDINIWSVLKKKLYNISFFFFPYKRKTSNPLKVIFCEKQVIRTLIYVT